MYISEIETVLSILKPVGLSGIFPYYTSKSDLLFINKIENEYINSINR